jgi:SAM-dependent methyltransferase
MNRDLCSLLACPHDGAGLSLHSLETGEYVADGRLLCAGQGHEFEIRDGIPDFRPGSREAHLDTTACERIPTKALVRRLLRFQGSWSLDAGCGRGTYAPYLPGRYVGMDLIRPFLVEAQRSFPHADFIAGDIRSIPFRPATFNVVLASQVLEHLAEKDMSAAVREMERVSRAWVIADTPNEGPLIRWLRRIIYPDHDHEHQPADSPLAHHTELTAASLRRHGFKVRGSIGHVTRRRFNWPVFWDVVDHVIDPVPQLSGNLIGVKNLTPSRRPRSG